MKSYNLAVIGGDGTGPEVVREAVKVLDAAARKFNLKLNYTDYDIGGSSRGPSGALPGVVSAPGGLPGTEFTHTSSTPPRANTPPTPSTPRYGKDSGKR